MSDEGEKDRHIHVPADSEQGPAVTPAPHALGPNCIAVPSPTHPGHHLESGSLCCHPWSGPKSPAHLSDHKCITSVFFFAQHTIQLQGANICTS